MTRPDLSAPASAAHQTHRSMRILGRHGDELHAVATLLTDDADLAMRLVVRAIVAPRDGSVATLRELSASVVRHWLDGHPARLAPVPPTSSPTLVEAVHGLPAHHRAALALCRFGDHTYREAAVLLDVPASTVAELLAATLRSLRAPDATPDAAPVTV